MSTDYSLSPHAATIHCLITLRYRCLVYCAVTGTVLIACLLVFKPQFLYPIFTGPISAYLHGSESWPQIMGANYLSISLRLSLIPALFITSPVLFYQLWSLSFPAFQRWSLLRRVYFLLACSLLSYGGIGLVSMTLFPVWVHILQDSVLLHLPIALGLQAYLGCVLKLFFIFGLAFQMPVIMCAWAWAEKIHPSKLKLFRPYVVPLAFITSVFTLPFSLLSIFYCMIPLVFLFEAGLFAARLGYYSV